jgi:uncharacterized protein
VESPQPTDVPVHRDVFSSSDFRSGHARLLGTRCAQCDEVFFPARQACPRCHSARSMSREELSTRGRIHALTHVARPATHYAKDYVLGLVDLDNGPRILAQLKGEADALRIGDPVELVVEPLFDTPGGQHVWGYRFKSAALR